MSLNEINEILSLVQKPVRYINGEWNSVHKDHRDVDVKVVLAYPDVYEIGASNLGLQIIYEILNERKDVAAERVYAPWNDLEEILRNRDIPLFSLESKSQIASFDIFGFTLQYEMTFTNILNMLNLAKIPLYSSERDSSYPLIIGGGPCVFNPEPLAPFFDLFVLGDGEEVINEIIDQYKKNKTKSREEILEALSRINGVYVPLFYQINYDSSGHIKEINPLKDNIPFPVSKRVIDDLDKFDFPRHPIVPFMNIVHDRCSIEIMRGCTRGCRFCQAGMIYRPVRERSLEKTTEIAKALIKETGYDEISFASLSSSDYSSIEKLFDNLRVEQDENKIAISLPSLRVDAFSVEIAKKIQKTKKTGLTFAPEAGTQRLRDVINKCVTEGDLYNAARSAFEAGWRKIKLYFMIGLPTETMDDLQGIIDLCSDIVNLGFSVIPKKDHRLIEIKVSVSSFVPKANTPFQWFAQDSLSQLKEKQRYLQLNMKNRRVSLNWHDAELSLVEGVFARGDRRLAKVLETAWRLGCKFDGWSEYFNFSKWLKAFEENNLKIDFYALRNRLFDEILPWDQLSSGIDKKFLISEYKKSRECETTPDCRFDLCVDCGVCSGFGVKNVIGDDFPVST